MGASFGWSGGRLFFSRGHRRFQPRVTAAGRSVNLWA